jgi:methylmalonyl-CoA/ethylmalonyl-CoA epimerase
VIRKVDHIGIAVKDLAKASDTFLRVLGLGDDGREVLEDRQLETVFARAGDVHVELLHSLSPDTPIAKFIEKRGEGLHHICFEVTNLDDMLVVCKAAGIEVIGGVEIGAHGKRIAFLHPKSTGGVLIELSEG